MDAAALRSLAASIAQPSRRAVRTSPAVAREPRVAFAGDGEPWIAIGVVLLIAAAGVAVLILRSRTPPPEAEVPASPEPDLPSPPDIEAELQEIIAEQHAREREVTPV